MRRTICLLPYHFTLLEGRKRTLLGKGSLEGLEDVKLNLGLGLLGLGGGRGNDLVGLGEASTDSLKRELLKGVGLDGVDGERVVAVDSGEAGRDCEGVSEQG